LIERSKGAPLDVNLSIPDVVSEVDYIEEAVEVLRPHMSRITALTIDSPYYEQIDALLERFLQCAPSIPPLKSLTLIDQSATGHSVHPLGISERMQVSIVPILIETIADILLAP
jgi:hypothetical protein